MHDRARRGEELIYKELKRSDLEELELQHVGVQQSEYNLQRQKEPSGTTITCVSVVRNDSFSLFFSQKSLSSSRVVF